MIDFFYAMFTGLGISSKHAYTVWYLENAVWLVGQNFMHLEYEKLWWILILYFVLVHDNKNQCLTKLVPMHTCTIII